MKTARYVRTEIKSNQLHPPTLWLTALLLATGLGTKADEIQTNVPAAKPAESAATEKGAPLPLHQIEGNGGIFCTLSAYIVNPPRNGEAVGRPSVGFAYVSLGHGQDLQALTLTESPFSRLELGYGYNNLNLGNLPLDVFQTTGGTLNLTETSVELHNRPMHLTLVTQRLVASLPLNTPPVGAICRPQESTG